MIKRRDLLKGAALALAGTAGARLLAADGAEASSSGQAQRLGKIALEEHFLIPEFTDYFSETYPNINPEIRKFGTGVLQDLGEKRLAVMDRHGIDFVVLSISGPGVQVEKDPAVAKRNARLANDFLAAEIQKQPKRYGGFAHLAMQDPAEAAAELERCIRELRFQGAMINGQTNGEYLDLDKYSVFWERAAALEAPIYLHPGNPLDYPAVYQGHSELWGPVCSWAFETAAHALRLVFGGVFERYPKARLILGHMGETLPLNLWRFDSRWLVCNRGQRTLAQQPSFYIKRNIAITTSGVCSDVSLRCALDALGAQNVMFSVDYPFEKTDLAAQFIETARVSEADRAQAASGNARRILRLGHI
ncbi:MAG TPA: amidohydrolase family protein [Verrucomicrobiae bacterium]|nr:amidohydrolase family protein [Verrucomicrobiae bacterium]